MSNNNQSGNDNRVVMRDINPGDKIKIGVTAKLVGKHPVKNTFHDHNNRGAMVYRALFLVTEGPMTGHTCTVYTSESDRVDRIFLDPSNMSRWDKWKMWYNKTIRRFIPRISFNRRRKNKGGKK